MKKKTKKIDFMKTYVYVHYGADGEYYVSSDATNHEDYFGEDYCEGTLAIEVNVPLVGNTDKTIPVTRLKAK